MEPRETIDETVAAGACRSERDSRTADEAAGCGRLRGPHPVQPAAAGAAAAMASASYVYVLGQIDERYPRPSVEKRWLKPPGGRKQLDGRTGRPFIRSCRNAKTAISRGNCAGC